MNATEIVQSGDVGALVAWIIIALVTGGVGAAIVQGVFASKRGVRGDALAKEKNAIDGFTHLTERQGDYMANLERRIEAMEADIESLREDLGHEVQYSNLLILTLHENTIPIPARPARVRKKRE